MKTALRIVPPLALILAIACSPFTGPQQELFVEASVNAPVVHADSGMTIRVAAFNPWRNPITFSTCFGPLGYTVVTASDSTVIEQGSACPLIESQFTIGPGDSLVLRQPVNVVGWPAGNYQLTGLLLTDGGTRASNPVSFQLVCRNPAWTRC